MQWEIFSWPELIICIVFFFAGIVDAVCGGGGLLTRPVMMATGVPTHMISGSNQCSIFFGSFTSFWRYLRGRHIHWRSALPTVPLTILGAFLGAKLNLIMPESALELVMIILLPIITVILLLKRDFGAVNHADCLSGVRVFLNALFIGLAVGCYQGFYAAGAGTFFILAFATLGKLDLITASGNTKTVSLFSNITAGLTYALSGAVIWQIAIPATLFNVAGNYLGCSLAMSKGAKIIRPMFLGMIGLLFLKIVLSYFS